MALGFFEKKEERNKAKYSAGFSLMEVLVGVAVFVILGLAIYQTYSSLSNLMRQSRLKVTAAALANEQLEIIRNLSYADVGIVSGVPAGKIPREQTLNRDGVDFLVTSTIRNIDDSFDGTIGGSPNDLSPADYKLVEIEISCASCRNFQSLFFNTHVAPLALETASENGALFVRVFDANGQPVQGASVHIRNNDQEPPIVIDDTTNNEGMLQVVDAPPGVEVYEIRVSKTGYSEERTYEPDEPENPNPVKPHATVAAQQLTQISFSIDKTSVLDFSSVSVACAPVAGIDFSLLGTKLIGEDPDVLKYSSSQSTDGSGRRTISGLEWDNYNLYLTDAAYDLIGVIPTLPLALIPDSEQDVKLVVAAKDPKSLMVTVKDSSTRLPLSNASVTLSKSGHSDTLTTGRGFLRQSDWSGGAGQADFINETKYFDSDGNIEINDPAGQIKLKKIFDEYELSGNLTSSTFDTGSASDFHQVFWQPLAQDPGTGEDAVRFQIATNNDKAVWVFRGPDGTSGTFYDLSNNNINAIHNGDRYLRYKTYLQTASSTLTPIVADFSFTFTSDCVPPGQVLFSGLSSGKSDKYNLTVSKDGYHTFKDKVKIVDAWQQKEVILSP
ncbi:MAG: prepilin-type N-terminal cleavage/methylation domain-containing protein [Candidatus Portnoybacteria bacterium]|nr:prepilin-type N-terminal cleavage/methylation domain-containing protein [Candidatus Portnoybacteria bacterium]